jgi:hypothetical protein
MMQLSRDGCACSGAPWSDVIREEPDSQEIQRVLGRSFADLAAVTPQMMALSRHVAIDVDRQPDRANGFLRCTA